jgi:uncharacterized protein YjiS (DUF1127 family)
MHYKTQSYPISHGFEIGRILPLALNKLYTAVMSQVKIARATNELNELSNEALYDLGIQRADIPYVAKYGHRPQG